MPLCRRTTLVVYDVLHYISLHGPRVPREAIVDYIHRATTRRPTAYASRLRAFERFKRNLSRLGIAHCYDITCTNPGRPDIWFVIPNPGKALRTVSALLDSQSVELSAAGEGVSHAR